VGVQKLTYHITHVSVKTVAADLNISVGVAHSMSHVLWYNIVLLCVEKVAFVWDYSCSI